MFLSTEDAKNTKSRTSLSSLLSSLFSLRALSVLRGKFCSSPVKHKTQILITLCLAVTIAFVTWSLIRDHRREQRMALLMTQRAVIDPAAVAAAARTMKLITVQVTTKVRVEKNVDSFFFGEGKTAVETPVVVNFGTDLSKLESKGVEVLGAGEGARVRVRIPRPTCVGLSVIGDATTTSVEKNWRRFGWWSGESQVKDAKLEAFDQANRIRMQPIEKSLTPADLDKVHTMTREQMATLIKVIVGEGIDVEVKFDDE